MLMEEEKTSMFEIQDNLLSCEVPSLIISVLEVFSWSLSGRKRPSTILMQSVSVVVVLKGS